MKHALQTVLPCLLALGSSHVFAGTGERLTLTRTIPLPGVNGRLGHLALDAQRQRLYVAATVNNTVEVVDVQKGEPLRPVSVNDPRDLLVLPKPNLLYVTSGKSGHVKVFDCAAGRALKTIGRLPEADRLRFDAPANRIYVANSSALTMINAQTGVPTVSILLAGHPEAFVIEPSGERLFVNVPAANQIAVIERLSREVTAMWPLGDVSGNYALALDAGNARLFVGCRQPPTVLVVDGKSGKPVTQCEIAGDVGDLFYDAKHGRLYATCGDGFLEVIDQLDADHYKAQPRMPTAKGARTSLLDAESDSLFLALPAQGGKPAEVRVYRLAP